VTGRKAPGPQHRRPGRGLVLAPAWLGGLARQLQQLTLWPVSVFALLAGAGLGLTAPGRRHVALAAIGVAPLEFAGTGRRRTRARRCLRAPGDAALLAS
jgi:hypothetical protein